MEYGLIGKTLKHSFSKEIHTSFNKYKYELVELPEDELSTFLKHRCFKGINVTIPYKEKVIPYLDYVSPEASLIGAVNTIVNIHSKLYGYNTDYTGFSCLLKHVNCDIKDKTVAILGTGGTSLTTKAVCKDLNAKKIYRISRRKKDDSKDILSYEELDNIKLDIDVIINATPCGMYPNNDEINHFIDISSFLNVEDIIDVVYNPLRTNLVLDGMKENICSIGGLYMLISQAVASKCLFLNESFDEQSIQSLSNEYYKHLFKIKENIVLIGMPSSGKSTLGAGLAKRINRTFYDSDYEIERETNDKIFHIIQTKGISYFRELERNTIARLSKLTGCVIATGGGTILDNTNVQSLKQNGKLYFLNRSLEFLSPTNTRPLSSSFESLAQLYNTRLPIYDAVCDCMLDGDLKIDELEQIIMEDLDDETNGD